MGEQDDKIVFSERSESTSDLSSQSHYGEQEPLISTGSLAALGNVSFLQELEDLPQGRHLGVFSTIILFISRIVGSGIFATASAIYNDVDSPVLFMIAWILAGVLAFCGLYLFLEMGSLMPRSGGAKVFLEFIYPKPFMLMTTIFALYSVLSGFAVTNSIVFGTYFLSAIGVENVTDIQSRYTGLCLVIFTTIVHGVSVKHGVAVQNVIGTLKIILLTVMGIAGMLIIIIPSSITGIENQLTKEGFFAINSPVTVSSFSSAIIKACFSYSGWNAVHTVASEVKNPVRTFKIAGPTALIIVTFGYVFINMAYLYVIPAEEIKNSGQLVGSLLFERIFGYRLGKQLLTMSVAICAGGNVFVVMYGVSRMSQEVFREGYLPFSSFMASNWPYGAPLPTLLLACGLTSIFLVAPPPGDIYDYIISIEGYPQQVFTGLVAIGGFILRRRHPDLKPAIQSTRIGTIFILLLSTYLCVAPFVGSDSPNPKGLEHWPNYGLVALLVLASCGLYWFMYFVAAPWFGNYKLEPEEQVLDDGLVIKRWVKVSSS